MTGHKVRFELAPAADPQGMRNEKCGSNKEDGTRGGGGEENNTERRGNNIQGVQRLSSESPGRNLALTFNCLICATFARLRNAEGETPQSLSKTPATEEETPLPHSAV